MIRLTPMDDWIRAKAGIHRSLAPALYVRSLENYQIERLNETIDHARRNSTFYRGHLACLPIEPLSDLSDITRIPFTNPADIVKNPGSFLAVRQGEIARIVTLRTSGSTGESKRLFFTEEDLELTIDFFHHGMSTMVRPGQRVAILLPGDKPDSVGDLLARGLKRMEVDSLIYGPITDPLDAAESIASFGAHCLVGIPTQVLSIARSSSGAGIGKGKIESVLLSTDYVPQAIVKSLEEIWGCRVFNHYGMTETGLGGGVECEALDGYHLREADLYFEIVDHDSGKACPEGTMGEVVFTTLTRRGMPLIRYRTGDIARIIPQPCPCGSVLRRMDCVSGRWNGVVKLGPHAALTIAALDEALFQLPYILDYRASVSKAGKDRPILLHVDVYQVEGGCLTERDVLRVLSKIPAVREGIASVELQTPTVRFSPEGRWNTTGVGKRKIVRIGGM